MKIPIMLEQYLEDIGMVAENMSNEELLDNALYVRSLASQGEWWGFSMYSTGKTDRAQKSELSRFIKTLSA